MVYENAFVDEEGNFIDKNGSPTDNLAGDEKFTHEVLNTLLPPRQVPGYEPPGNIK